MSSNGTPAKATTPASPEAAAQPANWREQFRRALVFVKPDRGLVVTILTLTLLGAALGAIEPLVLMHIVDLLVAGSTLQALGLGVLTLLGFGIAREVLGGISNWLSWRVRLRVHYRTLEATVGRLHSLPVTYHREQSVGGLMTKLDRGIQGYIGALTEFSFNILPAIAYLALALVLMVRLDWRLSLLVACFAPIPALIGARAAKEQTVRERTLMDRWSKIYSRFNEVLSGIVTVKSYTMEEEEKARFLHDVRDANSVVDRGVGTDSLVGASKNLVALLARIAAIALGGYLVIEGQVTVGVLVAFLGYIGGLFGPVQGLTGTYQTIRKASVSLDTLFSILDAQDMLGDAPDAKHVDTLRGEVEFDNVSFGYQPNQKLIDGIDLHVKPGEVVAVVGPSGSGKTTLMTLIQRLYDPTSGVVRVDGQDIRTLKQRSLRTHIGVVLQEALLFNDTVRNNIAYGRPGASDEAIEAAAKAANAHDFIMALPQGYDTVVGERGSRLSGGERQRVAIARALLKDPPILILDEATSALDAEAEALVQEALSRLIRGRTTFVIAHRLSTVVGADRIVVLRHGRIAEMGSHGALMALDGYYASLVQHQTRGLLDRTIGEAPRPLLPEREIITPLPLSANAQAPQPPTDGHPTVRLRRRQDAGPDRPGGAGSA